MPKPRLLWVGDSPTAPTGFARVTENVLAELRQEWAIGILGINYTGDPHKLPYAIYPAFIGGDMYGHGRYADVVEGTKPDVICILNDPWIVAQYLEIPLKQAVPVVAYMPIDAPNLPHDRLKPLNGLDMAVFYTQFGAAQARQAGYAGRPRVIPHGVNAELYRPIDKGEARSHLGLTEQLPRDVFIVGNVNRNQGRKRLDHTMMHFARWVEQSEVPANVRLMIHCAKMDIGWDLVRLAQYLGISNRLIFSSTAQTSMTGLSEDLMPYVYNALDFQVSTTLGEGWGLTTHEGMACGVPQLVPDWSALGEWPRGAVRYAPVTSLLAHDNMLTTLGGVVDPAAFIAEMDMLYRDADLRAEYGKRALARATEERFSWDTIAAQFNEVLKAACVPKESEKALELANA